MQEYDKQLTTVNNSTNGMAIAGFVLGLISLIINLFWIPSILGIVFSAVGLAQISKSNQKGKVFAIVGLIASLISIIFAILALVALFSL